MVNEWRKRLARRESIRCAKFAKGIVDGHSTERCARLMMLSSQEVWVRVVILFADSSQAER